MIATSIFPNATPGDRPSSTLAFGTTVYRYDVVSSTQDVAREWAQQNALPGTVVTARAMTAGRGRRGRIWHAPGGANLSMTVIGPAVPPETIWQVPLVVGRAVADALRDVAPSLRTTLRFPNDVLLDGRKVAGILIETASPPGSGSLLLIGIGVNVHAAPLPDDVSLTAISLEAAGADTTIGAVETAILARLTRCWNEWQEQGVEEMLITYHAYLDPNARRNFVVEGHPAPCRVVRIFANGAVLIETEDGRQRAFHAAQVVLGDD